MRGRLKVYLGYAPGVGKTTRLLDEAHALARRGTDVVIGYVEARETTNGIEIVPRRRAEYRGVTIEDMDVDAVLARRPQVVLVDDVAHTNVPGSRHRKRYQDVGELLANGIDVIAAFDVQHLESLQDLVGRAGVRVRETVPDTFLKQAAEIVAVDLAVEDLLARLPADGRPQTETLATLRELLLREVAEALDREGRSVPETVGGRIMVCMSSHPPRAAVLLRRASRMAGRLNTAWFVVYVETPREAPDVIDAEAQKHLLANIELARELGAEVARIKADDPVPALVDFARSHGVGSVVIGRSREPRWRRLLGRSVFQRLIRETDGFDLHIVSFEEEGE
jgi:two-component system, OmpR family, sensor histidine kinase KdpD